jgi:hypothetical protein
VADDSHVRASAAATVSDLKDAERDRGEDAEGRDDERCESHNVTVPTVEDVGSAVSASASASGHTIGRR